VQSTEGKQSKASIAEIGCISSRNVARRILNARIWDSGRAKLKALRTEQSDLLNV
jgi:hypothetical protein